MAYDIIIDDTREFDPVIVRGVPGSSLEEACRTLANAYGMYWVGSVDGEFFAVKPDVFSAWNKPDDDNAWDLNAALVEMAELVIDGLTEARGLFSFNENTIAIHDYSCQQADLGG